MAAVFLNIEKAYDTMWREGLLIKLGKLGINGKMYNYILDFLSPRSISLKWLIQCLMSLLLKMDPSGKCYQSYIDQHND